MSSLVSAAPMRFILNTRMPGWQSRCYLPVSRVWSSHPGSALQQPPVHASRGHACSNQRAFTLWHAHFCTYFQHQQCKATGRCYCSANTGSPRVALVLCRRGIYQSEDVVLYKVGFSFREKLEDLRVVHRLGLVIHLSDGPAISMVS